MPRGERGGGGEALVPQRGRDRGQREEPRGHALEVAPRHLEKHRRGARRRGDDARALGR